jgi:hypothetical protein
MRDNMSGAIWDVEGCIIFFLHNSSDGCALETAIRANFDLTRADLSFMDLHNIDLSGAKFGRETKFHKTVVSKKYIPEVFAANPEKILEKGRVIWV